MEDSAAEPVGELSSGPDGKLSSGPAAVPSTPVPEHAVWLLEKLLFLVPPLIGVGIVGVLGHLGLPYVARGLLLFSTVGYTLVSIGVPCCIVVDAHWLRQAPGVDWRPSRALWGVAALLAAPIAGVAYLIVRYRNVPPSPGSAWWWTAIAVGLVAYLFGVSLSIWGAVLSVPALAIAGIALAGTVAYGLLPIAIYEDASYAYAAPGSWRPNPGVYLGLAFLSLIVAPLQPALAGYYLLRRHRTVGTL